MEDENKEKDALAKPADEDKAAKKALKKKKKMKKLEKMIRKILIKIEKEKKADDVS